MVGPGRAGRPRRRPPGRSQGPERGRGPGRPRGRLRRDSNSTVADIDLSHVRYIPETSVLKSTKINSSDDWPVFLLKDAVIYRKTKDGQLVIANLCNVDLEGPFVVRGKLDVELQEQRHLLRNYKYRQQHIEIPLSHSYSIGYGPWPVVWASGKAGWFEINPAPEYESMYDKVCEGITLYYLVMQAYQDYKASLPKAKRSKAFQLPIEKLLLKYAVAAGDGVTLPEAKRRCQKHTPFLLAHFPKEAEITWNSTSFSKWLTAENKDLVQRLAEAAKKKLPPPPPTSQSDKDSPGAEADDSPLALRPLRISPVESDRSRRSKSRASRQSQEADVEMTEAQPGSWPRRIVTPIHPPLPGQVASAPGVALSAPKAPAPVVVDAKPSPVDDPSSSFQSQDPVQVLLDILEELADQKGGDTARLTEASVHNKVWLACRVRHHPAAKEISHFYAKPLLARLPSRWHKSPFYVWLRSVCNQPWNPEILKDAEDVPGQCVRRQKSAKAGLPRKTPGEDFSLPRRAEKNWPLTPRGSGKNPCLRLATGAKRPAADDDSDDDSDDDDERPRKAVKTTHDSEDSEEDDNKQVNDTSDNAMPVDKEAAATPVLGTPKETVRIVVRAEKIPTMSPSGPDGTWKCEEEGCNYIVRSAEEQDGKDLIAKHFQEHASRVEKINLALSEGTRGHLPINHLLEKIRSLGESDDTEQGPDGNRINFPQPIKRRLIV